MLEFKIVFSPGYIFKLYDSLDEYAVGNTAAVILTLSKYQLSDAQVVDKEINFMSCMVEVLGIIK